MIYREKPKGFSSSSHFVVGCIIWVDKKMLLLKRGSEKTYPNKWGLPGGKVNKGESTADAVIREVKEETGISLSAGELKSNRIYYVVQDYLNFVYVLYISKLDGVSEIKLNPREHTNYHWCTIEDVFKINLMPDTADCIKDVISFLD
ncbi:MAG: NUDIX hydrolase [Candidatus Aenigmarchaeota archaeon]|nr:NUDIX hydrolase [Candidatus Aenigmarchaeota archaeon]